jgi:hypothetical protein
MSMAATYHRLVGRQASITLSSFSTASNSSAASV